MSPEQRHAEAHPRLRTRRQQGLTGAPRAEDARFPLMLELPGTEGPSPGPREDSDLCISTGGPLKVWPDRIKAWDRCEER